MKVADTHPIVARGKGRSHAHVACQQDSDLEVEEVGDVAAGKDGTVWTLLHVNEQASKQTSQNVVNHLPGLTREARTSITTVLDAFKFMVDITMVMWLANYTAIEAQR